MPQQNKGDVYPGLPKKVGVYLMGVIRNLEMRILAL